MFVSILRSVNDDDAKNEISTIIFQSVFVMKC